AQLFEGDALDQCLLTCLTITFPLAFGGGVGTHKPRRDIIDRNSPGAEFVGKLPGEANLSGFGGGIRLDAGQADAETCAAGNVDDTPIAIGLHAEGYSLGKVERAARVNRKNIIPLSC